MKNSGWQKKKPFTFLDTARSKEKKTLMNLKKYNVDGRFQRRTNFI